MLTWAASVTLIERLSPWPSVITITPTPAATASLKVSTTFAPAATPMAPLEGVVPLSVGETTSTRTVCEPTSLTLPAASAARTCTGTLPSAGTSPAAKFTLQLPPAARVVFSTPPQLTRTAAPDSAVPVIATPAPFSPALTRLSPVTAAITGAAGAVVSMVTVRAALAAPVLPTASLARAVKLWLLPSARAAVVKTQSPVALAWTEPSEALPSRISTLLKASALPARRSVGSSVVAPSATSPWMAPTLSVTPVMVAAPGAVPSYW